MSPLSKLALVIFVKRLFRLVRRYLLAFARSAGRREQDHLAWGTPRSGHWPKVRAEHLQREPACIVCGTTEDVEVHHVLCFHDFPEKECDPDNLATLCNKHHHHLTFGHLMNFRSYNPRVRQDAAAYQRKMETRP